MTANKIKSTAGESVEDEILKKAKVYCLSNGKAIFVSYLDLGGVEHNYATHHIHMSSDAVYVLVFDMTEMDREAICNSKIGIVSI